METASLPQPPEQEFKVGGTVYVTFEPGEPGKKNKFVSKDPNVSRKFILPATGDKDNIVPGFEYEVELTTDTLPGFNAGAFLADVKGLSDFGQIQKENMEKGFIFKGSYHKSIFQKPEELVSVFTRDGVDASTILVTPFGSGKRGKPDDQKYGVWFRDSKLNPTQSPDVQPTATIMPETTPVFTEVKKDVVAAIEKFDDAIRIIDKVAEYVGDDDKLVPSLEKFKHFVVDKRAAMILRRMTSAFNRRSPLLLVGDTDTSKTSSLEYFCAQVGLKFYRLNLSGQTDTGEIIGKFVPNDQAQKRKYEKLIDGWSSNDDAVRQKTFKRVGPEAAKILEDAKTRGSLTEDENVKIAALNALNIGKGDWVFQYGYLPLAMIHGGMFLVDEVFLAEPQINERMNSALEQVPSLVISENGNLKIGPGGDFEVHPDFIMCGATNAAGMAGRSEQSDAFLRRWRDYMLLDQPEETDYTDMMTFLATGRHPQFTVDGISYQMPNMDALYPELGSNPDMASTIVRLGSFHMDVRKKAHPTSGAPTIGKDRARKGGKYTFTRSTLLSVMDYLANEKTLDMARSKREGRLVYVTDLNTKTKDAIQTFYIDPALPEDRTAIKDSWNMLVTGQQKIQ